MDKTVFLHAVRFLYKGKFVICCCCWERWDSFLPACSPVSATTATVVLKFYLSMRNCVCRKREWLATSALSEQLAFLPTFTVISNCENYKLRLLSDLYRWSSVLAEFAKVNMDYFVNVPIFCCKLCFYSITSYRLDKFFFFWDQGKTTSVDMPVWLSRNYIL